jgi:YD repeat-containing protein
MVIVPLKRGKGPPYIYSPQFDALVSAARRNNPPVWAGDNRTTGETMYNTGGSVQGINTFTYDAAGNMRTASNAEGTYTMLYNADGEVTVAQEIFGQTLTMSYDAAGNRTVVQDNFGTETSIYDADERLETREYAGISTTDMRVGLSYQPNMVVEPMVWFSAVSRFRAS